MPSNSVIRGVTTPACMIVLLLALAVPSLQSQVIRPDQRAHFSGDYRRYEFPSQCIQAARREESFVWRAPMTRDTLSYEAALRTDTLATATTATARQCATYLQPARFRREQLLTLAGVHFAAYADTIAYRLIDSLFNSVTVDSPEFRSNFYQGIFTLYQKARPSRIESIEPLLERITDRDPSTWNDRRTVRTMLLEHYWASGKFVAAARQAEAMLADTTRPPDLLSNWMTHYNLTWMQHHTLIESAHRTDGSGATRKPFDRFRRENGDLFTPAGIDEDPILQSLRLQYSTIDSLINHGLSLTLSPLTVDLSSQPPHTIPAAGRITLILDPVMLSQEPGNGSAAEYRFVSILKRLDRTYRAAGLDIVWVMQTRGYFRDSGVLTPEEELSALANYYFGYLKAPGTLVLERTQFDVRPDGVRLPRLTPNFEQFRALQERTGNFIDGNPSALIDRQGRLIPLFNGQPVPIIEMEAVLSNAIEQALKQPGL